MILPSNSEAGRATLGVVFELRRLGTAAVPKYAPSDPPRSDQRFGSEVRHPERGTHKEVAWGASLLSWQNRGLLDRY